MEQRGSNDIIQNGTLRVEEEYDRVIARYYEAWVLDQVTEWDETDRPVLDYPIAHSPSRDEISKALTKEPRRKSDDPFRA